MEQVHDQEKQGDPMLIHHSPIRDENNGQESRQQQQQQQQNLSPKSSKSSRAVSEKEDPMLGFLTLLSKVERPVCTNCEAKDLSPMFYCNTCGQAICGPCKENTHSAKMFAHHEITSASPNLKEPHKKCQSHGELCIMYSQATESLVCIICFRDLSPEMRAQCLDLDTAHTQKCEKLQQGLKLVRELESKIKEETLAHRGLLKELHRNAMREEGTIQIFSKILQGAISQTEEMLVEAVKRELQSKENMLEDKLKTLETLQSNINAYLSLSSAFINSASKFELLKLANGLVERLSAIGTIVQPVKISPESCSISSNFKTEFSQSLKNLLSQDEWTPNQNQPQEPEKPTENNETVQGPIPIHEKETEESTIPDKPRLPFLGKSQSLVNIPLNLDHCKDIRSPKPNQLESETGSNGPCQLPQSNMNESPVNKTAAFHRARKQDYAHHSLPLSKERPIQREERRLPSWRTSIEGNSGDKSPQYDVSQVELFATIQSRKAVNSRGAKNVLVTSMVGLRKSDRIDDKKKDLDRPFKYGTLPSARKHSGHVCVVQAMVHQDAENNGKNRHFMNEPVRKRRPPTPKKQWETLQETTNTTGQARRPTSLESQASSIELTPEQARDLIRAISAAQKNRKLGEKNWTQKSQTINSLVSSRPNYSVPRTETENTDLKKPSLERSDSFEGHEDAVQLLVDAVTELRQICCTKGNCEHFQV